MNRTATVRERRETLELHRDGPHWMRRAKALRNPTPQRRDSHGLQARATREFGPHSGPYDGGPHSGPYEIHAGRRAVMFASLLVLAAGCDTLYFPAQEASPAPCGLIVIFPGASGVPAEQLAWPIGLRQAGVNEAIEIVSWGRPGDAVFNATAVDRHREWSLTEAQRLARFIDDHPGCPVTLVGYSAGAAIAVFVAESMPPDRVLERVVLLSADLSPQYDLGAALERTRRGIVSYWSPLDRDTVDLTYVVGTVDGSIGPPAGSVGFSTRDERLIEVSWDVEMIRYGNFGGHFDYVFNPPWIEAYAAEWIRAPVN